MAFNIFAASITGGPFQKFKQKRFNKILLDNQTFEHK